MNRLILMGRLTRDPETKDVAGQQVATFSVATGFKKKDGSEHTDWHQVECWQKTAEIATKYLHKGDQVLLEGEVRYNTVEKDGKKTTYTKIQVSRIELLGSRQDRPAATASAEPPLAQWSSSDIPDLDNVPF